MRRVCAGGDDRLRNFPVSGAASLPTMTIPIRAFRGGLSLCGVW
jgi:hypothetical protein